MTDLLLIFLGTVCASELLLSLAVDGQHGRLSAARLLTLGCAGAALAVLAVVQRLPPGQPWLAVAGDVLRAMALAMTAWALAEGRAAIRPQDARLARLLRAMVPLLSANAAVAVLWLAGLVAIASPSSVALVCAAGSAVLYVASLAYPDLRERVVFADVPAPWRGLPIAAVTLCIVALTWTGLFRTLPW